MSSSSSTALARASFDPHVHRSLVDLRKSLQGFRQDLEALCEARRKNNANRRAFYAIHSNAGRTGSHEFQHQKDEPASLSSRWLPAAEQQPAAEHSRGKVAASGPSCIPDVALLRNQFKADIRRASEDGSLIAACDKAAEERETQSVHLDETMVNALAKKNVPTTLMDEMPAASHLMPEVRHSVGIMGTGKLAADSPQAKRKDSKLDKLGGEQFLRDLIAEFLERETPSKLANITRDDLTDIEVDDLSSDKARISALYRAYPKPDLRQIHLVFNNGAWCVESVLHPESFKFDGDACEKGMSEGGEKQPMKLLTPGEHAGGGMEDGKQGCLPLKITIVGAKGLRDADPWLQGKSDPYCVCEILGKSTEKVQTEVINNVDDPTWDHSAQLTGYQPGDVLVFRIYDSDYKKPDDLLGTFNMASDQFFPHGFDGEIPLSETGTRVPAQLKLKIAPFVLPTGYQTPKLSSANTNPMRTGGLLTESTASVVSEKLPETVCLQKAHKTADVKNEPLRLMIVKARGLQVPSQKEPPTAYCKFYIKGAPDSATAQTKVKAFSYVPVWDHEAELPDFLPGNEIVFDLYDRALGKVDDFLGSLVIPSEHFYPGGFEGELPLRGCEEGVNAFLTIRIMQSSPGAQTGDAALQRDLWGAVADRLEGHSLASELRSSDNVQKVPPPTSESAHAEAVLHKPDLQSGGFLVGRGYSGHENRGRSVEQLAPEGETSRGLQPVMLKAEGALVGIGYNSLQIRTRGQDRQHANAKQTPEAQETDVVRTPDTAIVEEVAKETEHHMGLQPVVLKAGGAFVGSGYNSCEIRNRSQNRLQESRTHGADSQKAVATMFQAT
mmetsp:Transcript_26382/g.51709  ORF Transcript_26382/g.51709 Transcript_26382/m.51709 type:complete len:838 (-) Transcript_26382:175-2688(-)